MTVNRLKNQIIGYSLSIENSNLSILNIKENKSKINVFTIAKNEKWAGMDMLTEDNLLIVASTLTSQDGDTTLSMQAYEILEENIDLVQKRNFNREEFNSTQFMRKFKGSDVFAVASKANIGIVSYKDDQFFLIKLFENVYENYIFEISIVGNLMIPVCLEEKFKVKVIELNLGAGESYIGATFDSMAYGTSSETGNMDNVISNISNGTSYKFDDVNDTYSHLSKILENDPIVRKFQTPYMSNFFFEILTARWKEKRRDQP